MSEEELPDDTTITWVEPEPMEFYRDEPIGVQDGDVKPAVIEGFSPTRKRTWLLSLRLWVARWIAPNGYIVEWRAGTVTIVYTDSA